MIQVVQKKCYSDSYTLASSLETGNLHWVSSPEVVAYKGCFNTQKSVLHAFKQPWEIRLQDTWSQIQMPYPHFSSTIKRLPLNKWSFCHPSFSVPGKASLATKCLIWRRVVYNTSLANQDWTVVLWLLAMADSLRAQENGEGGVPLFAWYKFKHILTIYCHFLCNCHCSQCCIHPNSSH